MSVTYITCVYIYILLFLCSTWLWPFRPKHVVENNRINCSVLTGFFVILRFLKHEKVALFCHWLIVVLVHINEIGLLLVDVCKHVVSFLKGSYDHNCNICRKKFASRAKLNEHTHQHQSPRFRCDVCGRMYVRQDALRTHRRIHTGERPFQCSLCKKSFYMVSSLRLHEQVYSYVYQACKQAGCAEPNVMLQNSASHAVTGSFSMNFKLWKVWVLMEAYCRVLSALLGWRMANNAEFCVGFGGCSLVCIMYWVVWWSNTLL